MKLAIIALIISAIGILIAIITKSKKGKKEEIYPFEAKPVMSKPEQILFNRLVKALPDKIILSQVQYSGFLNVKKGFEWNIYGKKINQKSVDFLILNTDSSVVAAIELDEKSHDTDKRKKDDDYKNKATEAAKIKMIRWRTTAMPTEEQIIKSFVV